jgi:hypothetical protein
VGAEHPPYALAALAKRAEAAEKWLKSVREPFQKALEALIGQRAFRSAAGTATNAAAAAAAKRGRG